MKKFILYKIDILIFKLKIKLKILLNNRLKYNNKQKKIIYIFKKLILFDIFLFWFPMLTKLNSLAKQL